MKYIHIFFILAYFVTGIQALAATFPSDDRVLSLVKSSLESVEVNSAEDAMRAVMSAMTADLAGQPFSTVVVRCFDYDQDHKSGYLTITINADDNTHHSYDVQFVINDGTEI